MACCTLLAALPHAIFRGDPRPSCAKSSRLQRVVLQEQLEQFRLLEAVSVGDAPLLQLCLQLARVEMLFGGGATHATRVGELLPQ